jgi:4-hydroxybenzoyl-CoA thioesterase
LIAFDRPVKFEEVDAARIVFFGHYVAWAHEAMDRFFGALDGGYARLILERRVGLPAVKVDMTFSRPLRYGDVARIETTCARLGGRSAALRYRVQDAKDRALVAEIHHTVVTTDLDAMRSCEMPADVRAQLAAHLEPP